MDQQSRALVASPHTASMNALRSASVGTRRMSRSYSVPRMSTCCNEGQAQRSGVTRSVAKQVRLLLQEAQRASREKSKGRRRSRTEQQTVRAAQCTAAPTARAHPLAPFPCPAAWPTPAATPLLQCTGCAPAPQSPAPAAAKRTPETGCSRPRLGSTAIPPAVSACTDKQAQVIPSATLPFSRLPDTAEARHAHDGWQCLRRKASVSYADNALCVQA